MKRVCLALMCLAVGLPALTGCGSSAPPPLAVRCTTQRLASGAFRVKVTVTNNTGKASKGIIFGPALIWLRHIYPVLSTAQVVVNAAGTSRSYIGFVVPRISPKAPAHVLLRFAPPARGTTIVATGQASVRASDWHVLDNSDCVIRKAS